MKNQILTFIIGVLVGAIIATGGLYLYQKSNMKQNGMERNGDMTQMMEKGNRGGTPPEKPGNDSGMNTTMEESQS